MGGFGVVRRSVRLWDLQGQECRELGRHGSWVRSVALTSDGRWAVSGSDDCTVRIWDLQGQASRELGRHGERCQVGGVDVGWPVGGFGVVRRCGATLGSAGSGEPRAGPARGLGQVGGVDFGWPVGGFGVVRRCGAVGDLQGQESRELGRHGSGVMSVALTSDGRWAVSGSSDGAVRLWDLQGQASRELGRHEDWVRSVALTSDGRWAVSGSSDGAVRLWDLQGQASRELGRHSSRVSLVAGTWMAGGRFRGRPTVRYGCGYCRVRTAAAGPALGRGHFGGVDVGWPVGGFGGGDHAVRLWDLQGRGQPELGQHGRLGHFGGVDFDGRWAVPGSCDGRSVSGIGRVRPAASWAGRRRARSVPVTLDGRCAVSEPYDGAVRLWDLQGQASRELGRHGGWVSSVALTADGRWAVRGSSDGAVRLWDLQGQASRELGRHGDPVWSVALTSDGRWAVSGS